MTNGNTDSITEAEASLLGVIANTAADRMVSGLEELKVMDCDG